MATNCLDVVVVGGGPAGASTALGLVRSGQSVALLERSRYDHVRFGETLPPVVRLLLAELGVWERFQSDAHSPSPGIVSAWGQPELYENDFFFNPYGCGWHVDRRRFDDMVALAAEEAGTVVYRATRPSRCFQERSGDWELEVAAGARRVRLRSKFLVDATGRASWVARRQGARRLTFDRLIGVIGFFSANSRSSSHDQRTLVEASENGWWYSALLPNHHTVVAYMTDVDLFPRVPGTLRSHWQARLHQTVHTRLRVESCSWESSLRLVSANSYLMDRVAGRNWLAVGDAALAFDPLSAQGVSKAVASGLAAAQTIEEYFRGNPRTLNDFAQRCEHSFAQFLEMRAQYYGREKRWPTSPFWLRRGSSGTGGGGGIGR